MPTSPSRPRRWITTRPGRAAGIHLASQCDRPAGTCAGSGRGTDAGAARYLSLITYSPQFIGRSHIDEAFAAQGLEMDVVLTAIDADVIKTYTELGLGVGIVAAMAYDEKRDSNLHAIHAGHLFRSNTTRLAIKRAAYLRGYAYAFIHAFAPHLTLDVVERARQGNGNGERP